MTLLKEMLGAPSVVGPSFEELVGWHSCEDLNDSSLDDGTSAIHTRRVSDNQRTTIQRSPNPGCICDCIELGVTKPEILLRSGGSSLILISGASTWGSVVAHRADFLCWANDERANLRALIFAEMGGGIDELQVFAYLIGGHQSLLDEDEQLEDELLDDESHTKLDEPLSDSGCETKPVWISAISIIPLSDPHFS